MKIVFVIDNYKELTNGTNMSAYRFAQKLTDLGHEVRIVTNDYYDKNVYTLKTRYIPIVSRVAKKQNITFSKPNKKVIKEAFKDADVVHLFMPWKTSKVSLKIAKKMDIPVVSAFHVPPESIIEGARLNFLSRTLLKVLYNRFKKFFKKIKHVHCPSVLTARQLRKYKYPNQFHVISNGVDDFFNYQKSTPINEIFNIINAGRYAPEKNQEIIIKAISKSKYKNNIKLTLAGKGPDERKLRRLARKHNINTEFKFFTQEELKEKIYDSHLYVHPSKIEIEGISCLEAVACGRVPLISNSKKNASVQFALDERSIFNIKDINDLKDKIEYWYENEAERTTMEPKYSNSASKYKIDESIQRYLQMLKHAIFDHKNEKFLETKLGINLKKEMLGGKIFNTLSKAFYFTVVPILIVFNKAYLRAKIKNKKNLKKLKGGAVIVSNHVHMLDSVLSGFVAFPKSVTFTSIKSNFKMPVVGKIVKGLGAIPIPMTFTENRVFFNELSKKVRNGKYVHFYPEGHLIEGDEQLREFKRGAFKLAVESSSPIVPIRINFIEKKNRKRKRMVVNVGKPIYPNLIISPNAAIDTLKEQTEQAMYNMA